MKTGSISFAALLLMCLLVYFRYLIPAVIVGFVLILFFMKMTDKRS